MMDLHTLFKISACTSMSRLIVCHVSLVHPQTKKTMWESTDMQRGTLLLTPNLKKYSLVRMTDVQIFIARVFKCAEENTYLYANLKPQ